MTLDFKLKAASFWSSKVYIYFWRKWGLVFQEQEPYLNFTSKEAGRRASQDQHFGSCSISREESRGPVPSWASSLWAGWWCQPHRPGLTSAPASHFPWAPSEKASQASSGVSVNTSELPLKVGSGGKGERAACVAILILLGAFFSSKAHYKGTFLRASLFSNSPDLTTPHGSKLKPQKNKQGFHSVVRKIKELLKLT